ncbi:MAG: amidohydrolase family protein [Anaerolineae bacterium]|jgi:hypothetical protein|nr:amidohydrolase family protein [Chloroflexota bacterium]
MVAELLARDMRPRAEVVTSSHCVEKPRFAAIDGHNHLPVPGNDHQRYRADLLKTMDEAGVEMIVNLSGEFGDTLQTILEGYDRAAPGRFATFCNVDWSGVGESGWEGRACGQLRADIAAGARGLKVFKSLGLTFRDTDGRLLMPDDPRIQDVWAQAGALGVPVLIHSGDPVAFFRPLDGANERWDELQRHPDWHFYGGDYPPFEALIESLYHTIESHPNTTFITAHVGCYPENLQFVSQMLDRYPNLNTDFSARIAELGRVPYSAREWFLKYADRIVFGTDVTPTVQAYRTYFRFLETRDEYMEYSEGAPIPPQGRWHIYGVHLPDTVLEKVYRLNIRKLLGLSTRQV